MATKYLSTVPQQLHRLTLKCNVSLLPSLASLQSHSLTVESDAEEATRIFEFAT